jgi:hypothetical protein
MYRTPGVYREEVFPVPPAELRTGVPAFVGLVSRAEVDAHVDEFSLRPTSTPGVWLVKKRGTESAETDDPAWFTLWTEFQAAFGPCSPTDTWPTLCAVSLRTGAACATCRWSTLMTPPPLLTP